MMISPATFYDKYVKGKNLTQLTNKRKNLKHEINILKRDIENPGEFVGFTSPSFEVRLNMNYMYLEVIEEEIRRLRTQENDKDK